MMDDSGMSADMDKNMAMMRRCVEEVMRSNPQLDPNEARAMCESRMSELREGEPQESHE